MAYMDIERARRAMRDQALDALLLCSPEDFYYSTGCSSMLVWLYRHAVLGMALIPAQADVAPAIFLPAPDTAQAQRCCPTADVFATPVWFESVSAASTAEQDALLAAPGHLPPAQYDSPAVCRRVAASVQSRGLSHARVGIEMDFVDVNTFTLLQQANPGVTFVDCTALMYDLRVVKHLGEVDALRRAATVAAAGIMAAGTSVTRQSTLATVAEAFSLGAWAAARKIGAAGELRILDGQPGFGIPAGRAVEDGRLPDGTTVKFDVQLLVSHYVADLGRTFVVGTPTPQVERVYKVLVEAQARMRSLLRPGTRICDIFAAARQVLDNAGMRGHSRGHFGHSVGLDAKCEEPPFICPAETRPLVPGMVLAVEAPFYMNGLGLFQLEDMCLITEDGYALLDHMPYDLQSVAL